MGQNTQALQVFKFENNDYRVAIIDGIAWFIAADVCKALDHSDVSMAVSRLDDDEKLIQALFVSGQMRNILTVNESGFHHLVLTSRKLEAKRIRKWMTSEVIPAIYRTGSYSIHQEQLIDARPKPLEQADILYLVNHPEEIEAIRRKLQEGMIELCLDVGQMQQQSQDLPALQRLFSPEKQSAQLKVSAQLIQPALPSIEKPSSTADRIQSEILRHLDRLSSVGKTPISANGLRDYMPALTRMAIETECRELVRQGVLIHIITSHTRKYARVGRDGLHLV